MKWYVLNYDFNKAEAYAYNIFNNGRLCSGLKDIFENPDERSFSERLISLLKYCFWSKCECEIYVTDAFHPDKQTKIDIYDQLIPNIEILTKYILDNQEQIKQFDNI